VANDAAVKPNGIDWRHSSLVQAEMTQIIERERLENIDNLAEARIELRELKEQLRGAEKSIEHQQGEISAMREVIVRARNIIRSQHLTLKPKHRRRLNAKDPGLKTGDVNSLADAWCPTCAVLIEMDGGGR
jgi:hypothetical protein